MAVVAVWMGLAAEAAAQGSVATDRAALNAFYDATGGASWADSTNWKTAVPLGEWYGVTTDADGRVTGLHLSSNGLTGPVPASLANLTQLSQLSLGWNDLTGPIPADLGSLVNLEELQLNANDLTGPIPVELGRLVNLQTLSLGGNQLTGQVPAWLENMVDLRWLDLGPNDLTGPIPVELGRLLKLQLLELFSNDLIGRIPAELGSLVNLETLDLSGNDLTGSIPAELRRLTNLERLSLGWNELTGPVPAWLGNLTRLRSLSLGGAGLTGPIPSELRRLTNLERLSLGWNELTGPVPAWLGNLTRLRSLSLGGAGLTGPIPSELRRLSNLEWLSLGWNELTGPVPAWLGNLTRLRSLSLGGAGLTGPIPSELSRLSNLEWLSLGWNELTGPIPAGLGRLVSLRTLNLAQTALTGPIPAELGNLVNLETLDLSYTWGLSGPLPAGLEQSSLEELDFFLTQTCAPAAWQEWLATIEFYGPLCEAGTDVTIDTVVVYTPAALEAAGGSVAIEAEIDLMIAETNEAYAASGVRQHLALVARSEVPYTETHGFLDLHRLTDPSDGHLDEAHALRDGTGADVVHLIVGESDGGFYNVCGIANLPGAFGITLRDCGGITFAHELGHNMGLRHDRFQVQVGEGGVSSHPAYGYVNRRIFAAGAPQSSRWVTIMSYRSHCGLADVRCSELPRFSNPRQRYGGDALGIPFGRGSGVTGPADAASVLNATGPAVAAWRERSADAAANQPPVAVGTLPDRRLASVGSELDVDVSQAFVDPDGKALAYTVSSAAPWVVRAGAAGARVTLTAVSEGAATIRVTATDPGGLSVSRSFSATVEGAGDTDPGSIESDRAALEALYDATAGAGWTDSTNWKTATPLGEWHGVTTDVDGRVTEVDLYDNALTGWLPPALGNLVRLESLRLGRNALTGPIPVALGRLANLEWLSLSWTELNGSIPTALGRLVNLRELDLSSNPFRSSNRLTGPMPAALGNLVNLERLRFNWNALTGPVPAWLGSLVQLRELSLDGNELTGRIPSALGSLANLESLSLSGNGLTGSIPGALGSLTSLRRLSLGGNELTGRIPSALGSLSNLQQLDLYRNDLTGSIPASLGGLANLERLDLSYTWGLSGPLPAGLEESGLEGLDLMVTRTCAPAAWQEWLATIEFLGPQCEAGPEVTIDVAVVYTPAAREAAGGTAGIEAAIDLMIAETDQAYAASGVHQRVVLTGRSEVPYAETFGLRDLFQLTDPSDGHLDEAHALRDETGADLVHLIVGDPNYSVCGIAFLPGLGWPGPFGITLLHCGGIVLAHEFGHNMGLRHDRFQRQVGEGASVSSHPGYGYVNQRMFEVGAPPSSRWVTVMSYSTQCGLADARCSRAPRFSNPRQRYGGDQLGVAFGVGSGVTGAADAAAVLNATGPAMAALRDRPDRPNRPPVAVGTLPDQSLAPASTLDVDVSQAFDDPDGDPLTYMVSSSSPNVATVQALGPRVSLTAVGVGLATIEVTATDPAGLSATQSFRVRVRAPFTDDPLVPGVTPIKAVHFTELRARIDVLREEAGLGRFPWTDPVLRPGVTRVRLVHLLELREALSAAYAAVGRAVPRWTDAAPTAGSIPIRAAHLTELRTAVLALE